MAKHIQNRIRMLDPDNFYEQDGVVFDADSFARHCTSKPQFVTRDESQHSNGAPAPVFVCPPVHIGWYPISIEQISYPIMAGANGTIDQMTSSSASSYLISSFTTSFLTSWYTSWGSFLWWGSTSSTLGGYGLELI